MGYINIHLQPCNIERNDLEKLVVVAAEELGYKTSLKRKTEELYDLQNNRTKIKETPDTEIKLKKAGFNVLLISILNYQPVYTGLSICYGYGFGLSRRETAEKYIATLSHKLK